MKIDFKTWRAFNGFRVCGNMDYDSLHQIISTNRIKTLEKQGLIKKTCYQESKDVLHTYRLTKKGQDYARAKMGMKHFEKPKGQERHQSHVGKKYASLTPQEQKSCMNQYDQKEYLYNRAFELIEKGKRDEGEELLENMKNASYIDLIYTTFENHQTFLMGVEISTSNYSYEDNSLHEQTAMELIQVQHYETIQI